MTIKAGDLVTILLDEYNTASNVFVVARKLEGECLLHHPLAPDCFIIKKDTELNQAPVNLKNSIEKCIDFAVLNRKYLDLNDVSLVEAISIYFIVKRKMSPKQTKILAGICGKVAALKLGNNFGAASRTVSQNQGVLDEYNWIWFNNLREVYSSKRVPTPRERQSVFNQAGFVLAQLEVTSAPQSGGPSNASKS